MPLLGFKCNEVGHFTTKYPNKNMNEKDEKRDKKYRRSQNYKEKGNKLCYIVEEENTKLDT